MSNFCFLASGSSLSCPRSSSRENFSVTVLVMVVMMVVVRVLVVMVMVVMVVLVVVIHIDNFA